jgi:hypothetical protein
MIDGLRERYDLAAPLADILVSDPYANFRENANSASYLGLHFLQGDKHHHVLLSNQSADFQIWIEDVATPIVRKISVTYANQPGSPQFTALLTDWNFAPRLRDPVFSFSPWHDTIIAVCLFQMQGTKGRDKSLGYILSAQDEVGANFFQQMAETLRGYYEKASPLVEIHTVAGLFAAQARSWRRVDPVPT